MMSLHSVPTFVALSNVSVLSSLLGPVLPSTHPSSLLGSLLVVSVCPSCLRYALHQILQTFILSEKCQLFLYNYASLPFTHKTFSSFIRGILSIFLENNIPTASSLLLHLRGNGHWFWRDEHWTLLQIRNYYPSRPLVEVFIFNLIFFLYFRPKFNSLKVPRRQSEITFDVAYCRL